MPRFETSRTVSVLLILISTALLVVVAREFPDARELLQSSPENFFSPYAAVPATDGGSVIHAFTQKLIPVQGSANLYPSDLGYGYFRLQHQALLYQKRLAQLKHALQNRVVYAYRRHLLRQGFHGHAAASVALLQSELDALKAHVTALAQELNEKNQLSASMADLQGQALTKMMARVNRLAALVHASARHRVRKSIPKPLAVVRTSSHDETAAAPCLHQGCTSNDLKWMQQLSRALSLIQAQSIHQAQMMQHVSSLSREVEMLRQHLSRRRRVRRPRYEDVHLRGKGPAVQLLQKLPVSDETKTSLAAASSSMRRQELSKLLDHVEAVSAKSPGSQSLDGLYDEIHQLQSLLSKLPSRPQKL